MKMVAVIIGALFCSTGHLQQPEPVNTHEWPELYSQCMDDFYWYKGSGYNTPLAVLGHTFKRVVDEKPQGSPGKEAELDRLKYLVNLLKEKRVIWSGNGPEFLHILDRHEVVSIAVSKVPLRKHFLKRINIVDPSKKMGNLGLEFVAGALNFPGPHHIGEQGNPPPGPSGITDVALEPFADATTVSLSRNTNEETRKQVEEGLINILEYYRIYTDSYSGMLERAGQTVPAQKDFYEKVAESLRTCLARVPNDPKYHSFKESLIKQISKVGALAAAADQDKMIPSHGN